MATTRTGFAVATIDDIEQGVVNAGRVRHKVREHFGIEGFGVNAMRAVEAGGEVINEHSESGVVSNGQQELYLVLKGHARFTVDGAEIDAPTGTLVFVEPGVKRAAIADEQDTTLLIVGGAPVWLSRTGFSGELGYELFLAPEHAAQVWEAVASAGAVPYGVAIIEPIRVEVGMIVTDYDYAPHERSPFDLGLDRVVALDAQGEFMGKETLRELAADPPNRFKTIRLEGEALPEYGATVTRDGEEVGVLTSPATSPILGPIGLAILRTDAAADGTRVEVAAQGGPIAGTVDQLALYDPEKRRPRA
jgi:quercetin dioxygenase-like cupin family protein